MKHSLNVSVFLAVLAILGCKGIPVQRPQCSSLDELLSGAKVLDVVSSGNVKDFLLFQSSEFSVWLRRKIVPFGGMMAILQKDKHEGAVYIFSGTRYIATIPTDIPAPPFTPEVYIRDDQTLFLLSYLFAPEEGKPNTQYRAQVHLIKNQTCSLIFEAKFLALTYTPELKAVVTRFEFYRNLNAQDLLLKLEYRTPGRRNQRDIEAVTCRETLIFDSRQNKFIPPPALTTRHKPDISEPKKPQEKAPTLGLQGPGLRP